MPRLTVTTPHGESTVELDPGSVVTIGRDPTNRVPLEGDAQVSRRHCRIARREGEGEGYEVVDLGSTNKTRVNGAPVMRRALSDGDTVEVGSSRIRFEDPEEAERMAAAQRDGVCFLEWVDKDRKGEKVLLAKPRVTVGRRETNTVVLDDRMASGHHCEIDRDINGYTIRDLGSTNGTLVNGEPITEALLSHGVRIRVGNSRFVFKDPSMQDVEVELAQFDEDEGWGMMGDVDLSRAPGSRSGMVLVLALFLAAGAGGFYLMQQDRGSATAGNVAVAGLVENGDFEDDALSWTAADADRADVAIDARAGRSRSRGLLARARGEGGEGPTLVAYDQLLSTSGGRGLEIEASLRRTAGETGDLVLVWTSAPTPDELRQHLVTPLKRVDTLIRGSGSWQSTKRRLTGPTWARGARLAVWLAPGSAAAVDDVVVRPIEMEQAPQSFEVPTFKKAILDGTGSLDLMQSRVVLMTGCAPVARLAGGTVLVDFRAKGTPERTEGGGYRVGGAFHPEEGDAVPASITWHPTAEGLDVEIACEGADAVGLDAALPVLHLDGALSVLGDFQPQRIPAQPGETLAKVEQTLAGQAAGPSSTLVAFTQADDQPVATLELVGGRGGDLLTLRHWVAGATARMGVVTDFSHRRDQARQDLTAAVQMVRTHPVRAFDRLSRVIQEYPFEPTIRDEAVRHLGDLDESVRKETEALADALDAFRHYGSEQALDDMSAKAKAMRERFLGDPGGGAGQTGMVQRITRLVAEADEAARAWRIERAMPSIERLERLVEMLKDDTAYQPVAAVYARTLLKRFGSLAEASADVASRLAAVQKELDKLQGSDEVRLAMPPVPDEAPRGP